MKTPEENKRGLRHCTVEDSCCDCVYVNECHEAQSCSPMLNDVYTYIQRLERERDALMEPIRGRCFSCRHNLRGINEEPCASCVWYKDRSGWEWRGVEEDEE